jgi:16S rRNA (cytosine967-C5)-methyltransferase
MLAISPARRAAFEILRRVEQDGAYSSALLARLDETMRVDDRALCHELVLGVLRRQLWLDRVIEHFANRGVDGLDLPVKLALRLGIYQLRFLGRIPASAAVNESVNLVRVAGVKSAAGFVNAVLRRATREPDYDPAAGRADPVERIAVQTSHPRWLISRWADSLGFKEAEGLARANNEPAPVALRLTAKALATSDAQHVTEQLKSSGARLTTSRIAPGAWRVAGGGRSLRELASEGLIYLQDEASQLVAYLLGAQPNDRVLDVCAAPGSKTTHIAVLTPRATIVAGDLYPHRLSTLNELAAQQGVRGIQTVAYDATQALPFANASFERVLVDAPCSGTGTLRHNPEIRWRIKSSDIEELAGKQSRIIANAAAVVNAGGRLVYSTCALEADENEGVVEAFMKQHPDFRLMPVDFPLDAGWEGHAKVGTIRTWPHRHDTDGFFVAVFERLA